MKQTTAYCLLTAILFSVCAVLSGCASTQLVSDWREQEIVIDGKYTDWGNAQSYYDENKKVVVNLLNDSDYLYICLISRNLEIEAQLMESGFVAWFDPDGGKKEIFGVRFPIGLTKMGMSLEEDERKPDADWRDQEDKSGLIDREKERLRDKDFQKHLEILEGLQGKLELLTGPLKIKDEDKQHNPPPAEANKQHFMKDKDDKANELSLEEAAKLGIEAKVGRENGYFVYELKVPLFKSALHPHAIQVKPDKPIGLGLEIPLAVKIMGEPEMIGYGRHPREVFQLWATVTLSGHVRGTLE